MTLHWCTNRKVASVLLLFLAQLGHAARIHLASPRIKVQKGEGRWQPQVNRLCDTIGSDVVWSLADVDGSGSFSFCACNAAECMTEQCPQGYEPENEECVRYETISGKEVPSIEAPVTCNVGTLQVLNGRAACFVEHACPEPPPPNDDGVELVPAKGSCGCEYEVTCVAPAQLVVSENHASCHTAAVKGVDELKRRTSPMVRSCPDPRDELLGDMCHHQLDEPPVLAEIDTKAIACGPKDDVYIERMLVQLKQQALALKAEGGSGGTRASCMMTCHAVFAKFSECAEQNSGPQCVGRAAKSGQAIRAIGAFAEKDTHKGSPRWLKKLKTSKGKDLPCKDMYGSEYNFKSGWLGGIDKLEKLAAKHYILLSGQYVDQPVGRLDCRKSYCGKAESYAQRQKTDVSCNACLAECASQYL